jgi:hypothetical protein
MEVKLIKVEGCVNIYMEGENLEEMKTRGYQRHPILVLKIQK